MDKISIEQKLTHVSETLEDITKEVPTETITSMLEHVENRTLIEGMRSPITGM